MLWVHNTWCDAAALETFQITIEIKDKVKFN